jgi:hypothetical protein
MGSGGWFISESLDNPTCATRSGKHAINNTWISQTSTSFRSFWN